MGRGLHLSSYFSKAVGLSTLRKFKEPGRLSGPQNELLVNTQGEHILPLSIGDPWSMQGLN